MENKKKIKMGTLEDFKKIIKNKGEENVFAAIVDGLNKAVKKGKTNGWIGT